VLLGLLLVGYVVECRRGYRHLSLRRGVRGLILRELLGCLLLVLILLRLRLLLRLLLRLVMLPVRLARVNVCLRRLPRIPLSRVLQGVRVRRVNRLRHRNTSGGVGIEHGLRLRLHLDGGVVDPPFLGFEVQANLVRQVGEGGDEEKPCSHLSESRPPPAAPRLHSHHQCRQARDGAHLGQGSLAGHGGPLCQSASPRHNAVPGIDGAPVVPAVGRHGHDKGPAEGGVGSHGREPQYGHEQV